MMTNNPDRKAEVICQFTADGKIIPLKIRAEDEDGEYQTYQARGYRQLTADGSANSWAFECRIQVFGIERTTCLYYSRIEHCWMVRFSRL